MGLIARYGSIPGKPRAIGYTLARKYCIQNFLFSEIISREITFQLQENIFLEFVSPKITYHVFFSDSENYMENLFGNCFPGISEESETTIKIKFALFRGGWAGGQRGKLSKTLFFHGKRHDNKILKVNILLSRNFVVMAQAPRISHFSYMKQCFRT